MDHGNGTGSTRRSVLFTLATGGVGLLSGFGTPAQQRLLAVLEDKDFRGRLPKAEVDALMKQENASLDALMAKLLPIAKSHAHPPLSNYFVGAVALGSSGSLYLGANIEVPGNILGLAVHAEQAAVANAYMSNEEGIEAIAVTAPPCGHCRQFLSELSLATSMRVLVSNAPEMKLADLLPMSFGPRDLGFARGALPAGRTRTHIATGPEDPLELEALRSADMSYSPYTRSPSGAALSTSTGRFFTGSYIENAAFNPSLPPLQAALAGYFAAGAGAGGLQNVVLAEGVKNSISQEGAARATLAALAPSARFSVVRTRFREGG